MGNTPHPVEGHVEGMQSTKAGYEHNHIYGVALVQLISSDGEILLVYIIIVAHLLVFLQRIKTTKYLLITVWHLGVYCLVP